MIYLRNYIILILIFSYCNAFSQNDVQVKDISLKKIGENLEITYTIVSDKKSQGYFPSVEIRINSNTSVPAKTFEFESDNPIVYDGINKIVWRADKDNLFISDQIYANIILNRDVKIPAAPHIAKTLIFPGWGNYRLGNSNFYFTYGLAGWGFMAGSVMLNKSAAKNYEQYKNTFDHFLGEDYYGKAVTQNKLSYACFGIGAAIWVANITGVIVKKKKVQRDIRLETSRYYYELSKQNILVQSQPFYFDNRPEWRIAMDNGDVSFRDKQFSIAKKHYEQANTIKPNDETILARIKETDTEIEKIRKAEEDYKNAIASGDSLFNVNEFTKAIIFYSEAKKYKPESKYPQQQIDKCNTRNEEITKENEYNSYIAKADNFYKQKNYDDAFVFYNEALKVLPDKEYPKTQLALLKDIAKEKEFRNYINSGKDEMRSGNYANAKDFFASALEIYPNNYEAKQLFDQAHAKLAQQEQERKDKEYKDYITLADEAFNNKEYDKAKGYYQKASYVKPNETYPKTRINTINSYLEEKKIAVISGDLPSIYENCKPAILFIFDVEYNYFKADYDLSPVGSGFFFTSTGYGVTNYHIYQALRTNGIVYSGNEKVYEIEKWYVYDKDLDYAIFKVKLDKYEKVSALKSTNSKMKEGQKVCLIGNPAGLKFSIKDGIISSFIDENTIEHSVPTTGGSSGSPVLNMDGEVIGLHTSGLKGKGNNNFATDIKKIPLWKYK